MNKDEFKRQFEKYRSGTLSDEEEEDMEDELEKLDMYQSFLETEMGESSTEDYDPETERRILKRSQTLAYFRTGIIAVVMSLLVLPTLYVLGMALDIIP